MAAHQRDRIQRAIVELACERGADAVTVRSLIALAGVSTRAFYAHFPDKRACFLGTYDDLVRRGFGELLAVETTQGGARSDLKLALGEMAARLAPRSSDARFVLLEAADVGPELERRMQQTRDLLQEVVRYWLGRTGLPEAKAVPALILRGIVAGATAVVRDRLVDRREGTLPEASGELVDWALTLCRRPSGALAGLPRLRAAQLPERSLFEDADLTAGARGGDRALILAAVVKLSRTTRPEALLVRDVCRAAGVSRRAFDAHFAGVEDCLLVAAEAMARRTVAGAAAAGAEAGDWRARVHRSTAVLCGWLAREPYLARLAFAEPRGAAAIRGRLELTRAIAHGIRAIAPEAERPAEIAAEASVAGALDTLSNCVAGGHANRLPRFVPVLSFMLLAPAGEL